MDGPVFRAKHLQKTSDFFSKSGWSVVFGADRHKAYFESADTRAQIIYDVRSGIIVYKLKKGKKLAKGFQVASSERDGYRRMVAICFGKFGNYIDYPKN